jgi:hypothetical protein
MSRVSWSDAAHECMRIFAPYTLHVHSPTSFACVASSCTNSLLHLTISSCVSLATFPSAGSNSRTSFNSVLFGRVASDSSMTCRPRRNTGLLYAARASCASLRPKHHPCYACTTVWTSGPLTGCMETPVLTIMAVTQNTHNNNTCNMFTAALCEGIEMPEDRVYLPHLTQKH